MSDESYDLPGPIDESLATQAMRDQRDVALEQIDELLGTLREMAAVHHSAHQSDDLLRRRLAAGCETSEQRREIKALLAARAALLEEIKIR